MGNSRLLTLIIATCLVFIGTARGEDPSITIRWTLTATDQIPLLFPSDAAFTNDGGVAVVDTGNHRLILLSPAGEILKVVGKEGEESGRFKNPMGVDIGPRGLIYVADNGNRRIQIFEADGSYRFDFPIPPMDKPADPTDLAVDSSGLLAVVDNDNHAIRIFQPDGKELTHWGTEGEGPGQFRHPFSCVIDKSRFLLVTDVLNSRIQFFDFSGKLQGSLGEFGTRSGNLIRPTGIARDSLQRVWITDPLTRGLQVYDPSNKHWTSLRLPSPESHRPYRLTIRDRQIVLVEDLPGRIIVGDFQP